MKNKLLKISLFLLVAFIFIPKDVFAISAICTAEYKNKLVKETMNVKVSYKPVKTNDNKYEFSLSLLNMPKYTYAEVDGFESLITNYEGISPVSIDFPFSGSKTYKIKFYVLPNNTCEDELIYVKSVTLPKYNIYSELDECIEYEEFPLCNIYYKGEIKNLREFKEKLEEYKESMKSETIEYEEEPTVFGKIVNFYTKNLVITLPVTIAIVAAGIFALFKFIILKNKSKKIGIDEFIE